MSQSEIIKDLKNKKQIFDWLIKNSIRDLESIGRLMNFYYMDREKFEYIIKNNIIEEVAKPIENIKNEI